MIAGTQSGKTSLGPWWLYRCLQQFGQGDYLAVTASYDLFKLRMLPELRTVFEQLLGIGRYWSGLKVIELVDLEEGRFWAERADDPMWGRIILRSAQSSGGLESATAKAAWLDECGQDEFTLEDWEAILRRLAISQGPVLGTTTPYSQNWLKTEVHDRWVEGDHDYQVIQFPSTVNPAFPPEEFARAERTMQDWRFRMFYGGEFARPAGLIYARFTDDMLVDPFPIDAEWPRVVGVDFGGANTAEVYLAKDPESGIWYLYDEALSGDKTTREHAQEVQEKMEGAEEWDAVGGAPSETQERRDWGAAGVRVRKPRIPEVEPGIDRVAELIKSGKFRVFRTCKGARDELGSYRRKLDEQGEPTDVILHKRDFHRLDALRYAATALRRRVGFG